ncbi:PTPRJ phosphatase, partial [Dicaeum eximium]|nr:PTPRJ phosphatase [Dicaeum eximium]
FTGPSRVLDVEAESINVTSVTLKWVVNDSAAGTYTYRIEVTNDTFVKNVPSNEAKAEIKDLIPGTLYNFTVFAVAADKKTEGEGRLKVLYTRPSPVLDIEAESINVTSVTLKWVVNDSAADTYTYRTEVVNDTFVKNVPSNEARAEITDLIPGTWYYFTVFAVAADKKTEGEGSLKTLYTRPSPVLDLEAESINVTSVTLKWVVNDSAADTYTYRTEVVNDTSDTPGKNVTSSEAKAEITDLIPGTWYNFTVFAVAADNETEGEGVSTDLYTRPSPVLDLEAESINVTSVTLKWVVNDSAADTYTYRIEVVNDTSDTPVKNVTSNEAKAEITDLIPGTWYNFTVFAVAADKKTEGEGVSIDLST